MRRPVRSHVANRRMFQGGVLSPLPQPTGILASSQPLVDQIAQNAVNPAGNVMMNQGGFANGGWNSIFGLEKLASGERQTYNVEDNWKGLGLNDRLNNTYNTNMKFSDFVSKNYADATVPSFTFAGEYAPVTFTPGNKTISGTSSLGPWKRTPRQGPEESILVL